MAKRLTVIAIVMAIALSSCGGSPAPAPTPAPAVRTSSDPESAALKDRAKELVSGEMGGTRPASSAASASDGVSTDSALVSGSGAAATPAPKDGAPAAAPKLPGKLSPEEQQFMAAFIDGMTYLVYYREKEGLDPAIGRGAATKANEILIKDFRLSCIDLETIEKNKADQQEAYEAETGGGMDLIQFIAQKLNADIYLEIDIVNLSSSQNAKTGEWESSAEVSIKIFDASTASLLGTKKKLSAAPSFIPKAKGPELSQSNAVASLVRDLLPDCVAMAKDLMAKANARGIRHELIVLNTPDPEQMDEFLYEMLGRVKDMETISQSDAETRFYVYIVDRTDALTRAITAARKAVVGLEDMKLVYRRGRSLTYNTNQ